MKKILLGLAVILILLAVALLTMPASVAWKLAKPYVPASVQSVSGLQGNLWTGSARIGDAALPVTLQWDIAPAPLLGGKMAVNLRASAPESELAGRVISTKEISVLQQLGGAMSSAFLNHALAPYRVTVSQPLMLENISFSASAQAFLSAEGTVRFTGGSVSYVDNGVPKSAALPPLSGALGVESGALVLNISDGARPLAHASLERAGLAKLRLRREWFDMLGINWPGAADAEGYVFEVQQPIF